MNTTVASDTSAVNAVEVALYRSEPDCLKEITELLHQAYGPLAAMGFNYVAATQSEAVTGTRLAAGIAFVAKQNGRIIGSVTYYPSVPEGSMHPDFYRNADVAHFGQFAVVPDRQHLGVGAFLMECVENKARQDGKREIACDTAEGALHLIGYYERRGYRQVGFQQWAHATYRSVILSKLLASG